jgi:hypothetical protein
MWNNERSPSFSVQLEHVRMSGPHLIERFSVPFRIYHEELYQPIKRLKKEAKPAFTKKKIRLVYIF